MTARQNFHSLSWQASYVWSKTLGTGGATNPSGDTSIANIYDAAHYYGPAAYSVPSVFSGSASYELPGKTMHNQLGRAVLAGWTLSAVTTAQTGSPFSLETTGSFVPVASALPSEGGTCKTVGCGTDITDPSQAGEYLANGYTHVLVDVPSDIKRKGFSARRL